MNFFRNFILIMLSFFLAGCGGGNNISSLLPTDDETSSGSKTWTLMIYLNGNSSLETISDLKLKDFQNMSLPSSVNILVMSGKKSDGGIGTRYYLNNGTSEDMGIVDMASEDTLKDFIDWGKKKCPADYYLVNIFSHGGGWKGLLRDEVSGNVMSISMLRDALYGTDIDIISFSACSMASAEVSYELRDCSQIMIASEEDLPSSGWPYEAMFTSLLENSNKSPLEFSLTLVENYTAYYKNNGMTNMTLSAIDLKEMDYVAGLLKNFTDDAVDKEEFFEEIKKDREKSLLFYNKDLVDINEFFNNIASNSFYSEEIRILSREVTSSLDKGVIFFDKTSGSSHASGLSLYFPDEADNLIDFNNYKYSELAFGSYNVNMENFLIKICNK